MTDIKLTWNNRTTDAVSQKIYRSLEEFDSNNLPAVHAEIDFWIKEYLDEDVIEDAYWYMLSTVTEDDELFSDCVRIEKGEAGECDPHWDKVVSLLHFDGDLVDAKGGTWVASGSLMTWEPAPSGFGSAIRFRGGNESITGPRLIFGSSDYTVELRFRLPSGPLPAGSLKYILTTSNFNYGQGMIIAVRSNTGDGKSYLFAQNGVVWSEIYGWSEIYISSNTPISDDQYHHVAFVRESGQLRLYLDGVEVGSTTGLMREADSRAIRLGSDYNSTSRDWNGEIDELRITKGVARYTENFIPPTKPFPNC